MNAALNKQKKSAVILSANLGNFDPEIEWVAQNDYQGIPISICRFDDRTFPPRERAMTSRLQPGIVKMFGWDLVPGFDYYIWVDASKTITSPDFGTFMLGQLGSADFAVFAHPDRRSIKSEYEFVRQKLAEGNQYLLSRYQGEWLSEQYRVIERDKAFKDNCLYASTGFAYRPNSRVRTAMKEWWFHKTRYLLHDQLALPYVLAKSKVKVNVIRENIYKFPLWEHTRKRR